MLRLVLQSARSALRRAHSCNATTRGAMFSRANILQIAVRPCGQYAAAAATGAFASCAVAAGTIALAASALRCHILTAADDTEPASSDVGEYEGERDDEGRRHGFGKVMIYSGC